ncbi:MAG: DUF1653 domain-containing protein, partial [Betaproteobacteria bacterium]
GGLYEVVATARDSQHLGAMTVYRALYGQRDLWVRPAAMFTEKVFLDGVSQPPVLQGGG